MHDVHVCLLYMCAHRSKIYILLQSGQAHSVTQIHIPCWTPEGLCANAQAIISVTELVEDIQMRTGNKPIVVHGR